MYKSLLPVQAPMPRKGSWIEGNVTEEGDGTCEVAINLRFISVSKTVVAARKQGDEVDGKSGKCCRY